MRAKTKEPRFVFYVSVLLIVVIPKLLGVGWWIIFPLLPIPVFVYLAGASLWNRFKYRKEPQIQSLDIEK